MRAHLSYLLITLTFCISCSQDDTYIEIENDLDEDLLTILDEASQGVGTSFFTFPESTDYNKIPQDPLNPITKEKVLLGKLLFHETATGGNPKLDMMKNTYSCASCHQAAAGFAAGLRQGIGECGVGFGLRGETRVINPVAPLDSVDVQPLKSPTVLNVAYQDVMLWNGQFGGKGTNEGTEASWTEIQENFLGLEGVEVQAIKGQGVHRIQVDKDFVETYGYTSLFDTAFPDIPVESRYTTKQAALAMAAYERTLLANQSPLQEWLKGSRNAMSQNEKKGAILFFSKGKCYECHTGPALNDTNFYAFGMGDFENTSETLIQTSVNMNLTKRGRGGFTKESKEDYKFKTPTLYNIVENGFYGHGSTFTSVEEVILYKMKGIPQNSLVPEENLAPQFGNIDLTDEEVGQIAEFIKTGLLDPDLDRYVPETLPSGQCFPNNDETSRIDLGCN